MNSNDGFSCPACGKALETVQVGETELEACVNGCGGIWFDAAELFRLDSSEEGADDPVLQKLLSFETPRDADNRDKITCIKCGIKMKRHEYRENAGIFVDTCYGCGGLWLDGGELKELRESQAVQLSNKEREQMAKDFARKVQDDKRRIKEEAERRLRHRHRI
ncbi:MAG TPA: zf-TFIIB domain-containing protein [Candidatus Rifleibacterium sp.]|nr:zf-TFIIB domain-containing protein [Candidatus Rifleibacterium sp.]HPT44896.1 zf-TFIIB domain-containing protein [Candidatus Rifleibacterium sp.]